MKMTPRALLPTVLVLAIGVAASIAFADHEPRRAVVKPEHTTVDAGLYRTDVIMVKYRDGLQIRLRNDALTDFGTGALRGARGLLTEMSDGVWQRSHSLPEERLDQLRLTAERNLNKAVADLNLQYNFYLPAGADVETTIDAFNAQESVEIAMPMPLPVAPPLPPDFVPNQGYLNPAQSGINASCMWLVPGGTGTGIRIADLEYSWNLSHQDLPTITTLGPAPNDPFGNTDHGTAVLGELSALNNGWGVRGIAYGATMYVVAVNTGAGAGVYDVGAAITTALGTLVAGDVILIEQQAIGPNYTGMPAGTQFGLVPVEWNLADYNAIVTAVGNGVIVVEAAANGSQNLDAAVYGTGNGGHWPFLPANDSGAFIVGAGATPGGSDTARSRLSFSNYGLTVDLQGWGENVYSTGYGNIFSAEGVNRWYTATFGGTSSASPIVTGACAAVQAAYKLATSSVLTPAQMLTRLQATGSSQQAGTFPVAQNIGPLPNAAAAIASLVPSLDVDSNLIPDPCTLCTARITSSDVEPFDAVGFSVAIDGNVVAVGVTADGTGSISYGSVYIFRFDGLNYWSQEAHLNALVQQANDQFGNAVAVSGDLIVVGMKNEDDTCPVPGICSESGAAFVYRFNGSSWILEATLAASDAESGFFFGQSVAVRGDFIVVGAHGANDNGVSSGSAYIFHYNGTAWVEVAKLLASNAATLDRFGHAVAIGFDTVVVGAILNNGTGAAYIYNRNVGGADNWGEVIRLTGTDTDAGDQFGNAVSISGNAVAIGARGDDDNGTSSGSVYVFRFDGLNWTQEDKLTASDGEADDRLGNSLAISGDVLVSGARRDDDACPADPNCNSGAGYVFRFDGNNWSEEVKLTSDPSDPGAEFGFAVAVSNDMAIFGAPLEGPENRGAAYISRGLFDCNGNGTLDICDISSGVELDCNENGISDSCDISLGISNDTNSNGIPDICECLEDTNGDLAVNVTDLLMLLAAWGPNPGHVADFNDDGNVNVTDLLALLAAWGACP